MPGAAGHRPYLTGPLRKQRQLQQLLGPCPLDWQPNSQHFLRLVEY